jgi:hypothetical protein
MPLRKRMPLAVSPMSCEGTRGYHRRLPVSCVLGAFLFHVKHPPQNEGLHIAGAGVRRALGGRTGDLPVLAAVNSWALSGRDLPEK